MNARVDPVAEAAELPTKKQILIVTPRPFGACIQSVGAIQAIRRHHQHARVCLLTTPDFGAFTRRSNLADDILSLPETRWWQAATRIRTARRLRRQGFDRVYDLGGGSQSQQYRRVVRRADWSAPPAATGHLIDRQRNQLHDAGIAGVPLADLSWVSADIDGFGLIDRYVLFVLAGGDRPAKLWPAEKFAALARRLLRINLTPVLLGDRVDEDLLRVVRGTGVGIRNLIGRASPGQMTELARGASGAIGNDTDIMHLLTLAGCPSLVLYSRESMPALNAPRPGAQGGKVTGLQRDDLRGLSVDEVEELLPFDLT